MCLISGANAATSPLFYDFPAALAGPVDTPSAAHTVSASSGAGRCIETHLRVRNRVSDVLISEDSFTLLALHTLLW